MTAPPGQSRRTRLVIVGASLAGLRAAEAARKSGFDGQIVLIGDERHLPYDRPPLSKAYLEGSAEATAFRDRADLDASAIETRLGCSATGLDPGQKVLFTSGGDLRYDAMLVATGCRARSLHAAERFVGVHTLRTIDDARAIRGALSENARIVVVGAGFIGSEVASAARDAGCKVTVLEAASTPLARAVGEQMGAELAQLHVANEVALRTGCRVSRLHGRTRVEAVEVNDGTIIDADCVVIGVGAVPCTDWLEGSGIALDPQDRGVVCDASMATSKDGVWAAGDVAHWHNDTFGRVMRLEHWTSAAEQAAVAAWNATNAGPTRTYSTVPYFWSDWYKQRIQFVGDVHAADVEIVSGTVSEGRMIALYRAGDRLVGALTLNEPRRIMKLRRLIANGGRMIDGRDLVQSAARTASAGR